MSGHNHNTQHGAHGHQQGTSGGAPIITQVSQPTTPQWDLSPTSPSDNNAAMQSEIMNEQIRVNARGTIITMTRHELSRLPQCILVGIANSLAPSSGANINNILMADIHDEPIYINFPPNFLEYTLNRFREMEQEHKQRHNPQGGNNQGEHGGGFEFSDNQGSNSQNFQTFQQGPQQHLADAIRTNPAVIVLREDLDFYCLPPTRSISKPQMNEIKRAAGVELVKNHNYVLTGLEKSSSPGSPESHLIEMLCSTGFKTDEKWGYREMEPEKTVVSSLALVQLRTDNEEEGEKENTANASGSDADADNSKGKGFESKAAEAKKAEPLKTSNSTTSYKSTDTFGTDTASLHTAPESPPYETENENHLEVAASFNDVQSTATTINESNNNINTINTNTINTTTDLSTNADIPPSPPHAAGKSQDPSLLPSSASSTSSSSSSSSEDEYDTHTQSPTSQPPVSQPSSSSSSPSAPASSSQPSSTPVSPPPPVDLAKSQKLFLFWKKPARKCWWYDLTLENLKVPIEKSAEKLAVNATSGDQESTAPTINTAVTAVADNASSEKEMVDIGPIKVHIRCVWTLELCIVD